MYRYSYIAAVVSCVVIILTGFLYYAKWKKSGTEATLSWDVSGYYMYLPATFIYNDLRECKFQSEILTQYQPTYDFQQAFIHPSGNHVMKYPVGMAIMYTPPFAIAHSYATVSDTYPNDGFSKPYQLTIFIWNFLIAFLGIFTLRKVILRFYGDKIVALTLILITIGSNYLNYSAIDGAMTHNYLFTLYALLIDRTIKWHKSYKMKDAILIGLACGLMALIRPTEIIAVILPLSWGITLWNISSLKNRITLLWNKIDQIIVASLTTMAIGMFQLSYWKYISGDWLVYSYQDQGFSWLHPHIHDGLLSYKSGWLVYSPIMLFAIFGCYYLIRKDTKLAAPIIAFLLLFTYIVTAWDIWWYGGSLGNRAMVQSYPLWAFGIASLIEHTIFKKSLFKWLIGIVMAIFIYFNLWFTHQAHLGGLLHAGAMTKAYFWKTLGTYERNPLDLKLLDTDEFFEGERENVKTIHTEEFEKITSSCITEAPVITGLKSLCINENKPYSDPIFVTLDHINSEWLRVSADYLTTQMEWNVWKMAQCQVTLYNHDGQTSTKMIRIQRHLQEGFTNRVWIDLDLLEFKPIKLQIQWWNAGSPTTVVVDNLSIETFDSKR